MVEHWILWTFLVPPTYLDEVVDFVDNLGLGILFLEVSKQIRSQFQCCAGSLEAMEGR